MRTTVITTTVRVIPTKDVVRGMTHVPPAATVPLPATAITHVRAAELTVRTMAIRLIPAAAQAVRTVHLPLKVRDIHPALAEEQRALMVTKAAVATVISAAALTAITPQVILITVIATAAVGAAAQAQVTAAQVRAAVRVQAAAGLHADQDKQ